MGLLLNALAGVGTYAFSSLFFGNDSNDSNDVVIVDNNPVNQAISFLTLAGIGFVIYKFLGK